MGYKTTATTNTVHLVALHDLSTEIQSQCAMLRQEAGRCWTDLVQAHVAKRQSGVWLSEADLKQMTKGRYALHSQSVQALAEKLVANVDTARRLRQQQREAGLPITAEFPHHSKPYQTVTWKQSAIRVHDGRLMLSNGKDHPPLVFSLPNRFVGHLIRQVELLWRVDRYELALTVEAPAPPLPWADGQAAGIDLGEVNIAAIVSQDGHALVISGRYLRSIKRLRNKRHSTLSGKLARCRKGSRRWRRLKRRKAQASALFQRQQRDILHKASRQIVQFSRQHNVNRIAIGDVRNIANHVDKGQKINQKITQWAHGYLRGYVGYKSRAAGMRVHEQDEAYSTRTCCHCNCLLTSAPRGRVLRCPGCGFLTNRDANGGANICSRFVHGSYGRVQPTRITYQRPVAVVAPRTQARGSPPVAVRHEPPETSSSLGECHVHFTG